MGQKYEKKAKRSFWVLTWKLTEEQQKGNHTDEGVAGTAKTRLVTMGNRDPQQALLKVETATPWSEGRLVAQPHKVSSKWKSEIKDAENAFLCI